MAVNLNGNLLDIYADKDAPYIHSRYGNLYSAINNLEKTTSTGEVSTQMKNTLERLQSISNQLRREAASFLGVGESDFESNPELVKQSVKEILSLRSTAELTEEQLKQCSTLAFETIHASGFYQKVFNKILPPLDMNIFQGKDFKKNSEILTLEPNGDFFKFSDVQKIMIDDLFSNQEVIQAKEGEKLKSNIFTQSGLKKFQQHLIDNKAGTLRSKKGKINTYVKEFLLKEYAKQDLKENLSNAFFEVFSTDFRERAKTSLNTNLSEEIVNQYLNSYVRSRVNMAFRNIKKIGDLQGVKGAGGEEFFAALTGLEIVTSIENNNINNGISITNTIYTTGLSSNQDVYNFLNIDTTGKTQSLKNGNQGTQGYIDLILVNKNGQKANIQSKNYDDKEFFSVSELKKGKEYFTLNDIYNLQSNLGLGNKGVLTGEDEGLLSYVIANDLWFQYAGSYFQDSENTVRSNSKKSSNGKINTKANQAVLISILSDILINSLGVMVDQSIPEIADVSMSNLFFLINNTALIPTFEIINALIRSLTKRQEAILGIRVSLYKGSYDYNSISPEAFYRSKRNALPLGVKMSPDRRGEDAGLVDVGKSMGRNIIDGGVGVKSFNLNFSSENILKSSYNFTNLIK